MNNEPIKKVEDILGSLDGMKQATAPDFFYTRLKARMEKGYEPVGKRQGVLRPVFAFAALAVVLLVNAVVVFTKNDAETGNLASNDNEIQSVAAEYNLNDLNSTLYDISPEK